MTATDRSLLRVVSWNVRRASSRSATWDLFRSIDPDVALLQEVGGIPESLARKYEVVSRHAAGKTGPQRFSTAVLVKGKVHAPIPLASQWDWVNREIERFHGNLVAYTVTVRGHEYRVLSVYSPAWPVDRVRLEGIDVTPVKLTLNPDVWVTELLWAALLQWPRDEESPPWIVGGDLNASETFDYLWKGGPRGNRQVLDRMADLGLTECLRASNGCLVPTFRNAHGGGIVHQMDHLWVSKALGDRMVGCATYESERVFAESLSDHLPIVAEFREVSDRADGGDLKHSTSNV